MTEDSYTEAQKVMQKARAFRHNIAIYKADVRKWTALEDHHRIEKQEAQRVSAKRLLDKALQRLKECREKFAALTFPDSNLTIQKTSDCIHGYSSKDNCPESSRCTLCTPIN